MSLFKCYRASKPEEQNKLRIEEAATEVALSKSQDRIAKFNTWLVDGSCLYYRKSLVETRDLFFF